MTAEYDHFLDARGLSCPEPLMMVRHKIMDMDQGQLLKVVATDPSTFRDIPKYCSFLHHELLKKEAAADTFTYLIRKG